MSDEPAAWVSGPGWAEWRVAPCWTEEGGYQVAPELRGWGERGPYQRFT